MTRETKIGLLVGLAFIIVIGILLSDHLSSTNEPLGAPLRVAGDTLRSGLGQPGNNDIAPMLKAPANVAPNQQVVTNEELKHQATPPVHFVNPPVNNGGGGGAITPNPVANNNGGSERLRQLAQQQGEDVVPVNPNGNQANNANTGPVHFDPPVAPPAPKATARTYVAQSGDSLSTIAQKAYGSGNKANREAIVAANPALAENRDLIVAGRTYLIPALSNTPVAPASPTHAPEKSVTTASLTYTVKARDTLWSIATNEVGNPNAVAAIKELNQDVLNGSERLRPNMKLTLPTKKNVE